MVEFCDLVGTGIAPVSKKTVVKYISLYFSSQITKQVQPEVWNVVKDKPVDLLDNGIQCIRKTLDCKSIFYKDPLNVFQLPCLSHGK